MKLSEGTKSVLFGSHSIAHSVLVIISWKILYKKFPNWKEVICIFLHDIGYWGTDYVSNGSNIGHAELGAKVANKLFGKKYEHLVLGHSLSACNKFGIKPSKMERPDEYSFIIAPMWWLKWNQIVEPFITPAEIWKKEVTKNFYSNNRISGTELLNKMKEGIK